MRIQDGHNDSDLSHPKYRPDIDGLRAIAVLSVVTFHAFPSWMKGGFIGVDVFFVISGYLISTIIFENLDRGTFSFATFYARRIKRIFPALLLVLTASYAFGWVTLFADEFKQLGKHIAAGAGFVSNLVLWNELGYFDNSAETKPLLHLWSLGIEEQFYIFWPFLLWLTWKQKFNILTVTLIVAAVSFYLNVAGVRADAVATFYSPQTRFWELLGGSLLAWVMLYRKDATNSVKAKLNNWAASAVGRDKTNDYFSNALAFAGLAILVYGFWCINKELNFPGIWAIAPVLGAVLLILSGPNAWVNRSLLSNRVAVWFGLISFPLYLWHWPLLSFARIIESHVPDRSTRMAAVLLAIALAWLTYKLVESPIRSGRDTGTKVSVLVVFMVIMGSAGYYTYSKDGLSYRTKDREEFISYFSNSFPTWKYFKKVNMGSAWRSECAFFNYKEYEETGKVPEGGVANSRPLEAIASSCYQRDLQFNKSVLIWGDSHAQALYAGVIQYIPKNWQVLQVASSACPPNPGIKFPSKERQCAQSNYFAVKTISDAKPDVVVIAQSRLHSAKTMSEMAEKLESLGVKKILFLGPTPQWTADLPKILARQLWATKPRRTFIGIDQDIMEANKQLLREFGKTKAAEFVDVISLFCDAEGCLTYTEDDIKSSITTFDYGHLTPSASKFLSKNLLIQRIVAP